MDPGLFLGPFRCEDAAIMATSTLDGWLPRHLALGYLLTLFMGSVPYAFGWWSISWYVIVGTTIFAGANTPETHDFLASSAVAFLSGSVCAIIVSRLLSQGPFLHRTRHEEVFLRLPDIYSHGPISGTLELCLMVMTLLLIAFLTIARLLSDGCAQWGHTAPTTMGWVVLISTILSIVLGAVIYALLPTHVQEEDSSSSYSVDDPLVPADPTAPTPPRTSTWASVISLLLGIILTLAVPILEDTRMWWQLPLVVYWVALFLGIRSGSIFPGINVTSEKCAGIGIVHLLMVFTASLVDTLAGGHETGGSQAAGNTRSIVLTCLVMVVTLGITLLVKVVSTSSGATGRIHGLGLKHVVLLALIAVPTYGHGVGVDLVPDEQTLQESLRMHHNFEFYDECLVSEGCIKESVFGSKRTLLRYTSQIWNLGDKALKVGLTPGASPKKKNKQGKEHNPTWHPAEGNQTTAKWEYHGCHGHWHLEGFAEARLVNNPIDRVVVGGADTLKVSFCLRDNQCMNGLSDTRAGALLAGLQGNTSRATSWEGKSVFTCDNQGVSPGCSDIYSMDLPCQWLDVTMVPPGVYWLELEVNPYGLFEEGPGMMENNIAWAIVNLVPDSVSRSPVFETVDIPIASWILGVVIVCASLCAYTIQLCSQM